jgi:AsmA family protein
LLSNATLSVSAVRRGDAVVNFHARGVELGRVPLHGVSAKVTIDHGILTVSPLAAEVYGGKLLGRLRLDARRDVPPAEVDLKITDLQLEQIDRKDSVSPPFEGLLQARVAVAGRGSSVHQVAASANGTVTAAVPKGAIRASLAELTGIDLRGVGLLLTKNTEETAVRCGAASFQAHEGTLTVQSLVVDTERVLIVGEGQIHLDSEDLDLTFRGQPKQLRLFRLRLPILVRGTLAHPEIAIQAHDAAQKSGVPQSAMPAATDRGLAKDADCAALLAQSAPQNNVR